MRQKVLITIFIIIASSIIATGFFYIPIKARAEGSVCEHSFISSEIEATCQRSGQEKRTCIKCGYSVITSVSPAKGHSYKQTFIESTCSSAGFDGEVCIICGAMKGNVIPMTSHNWTYSFSESSCEKYGLEVKKCSYCGLEEIINVFLPLEHNYAVSFEPPSKNDSGIAIYSCLICGESHCVSLGLESMEGYQAFLNEIAQFNIEEHIHDYKAEMKREGKEALISICCDCGEEKGTERLSLFATNDLGREELLIIDGKSDLSLLGIGEYTLDLFEGEERLFSLSVEIVAAQNDLINDDEKMPNSVSGGDAEKDDDIPFFETERGKVTFRLILAGGALVLALVIGIIAFAIINGKKNKKENIEEW